LQTNANNVLRMLDPGLGATFQDRGRVGWRRYGIPLSGCMDPHSADCANRLLENVPTAAVIELLLQNAKFETLQDVWVAICGADVECSVPTWRAHHLSAGEIISIQQCRTGLWSYLAVEGGFAAPEFFGSASSYPRGGLGGNLLPLQVLIRNSASRLRLPRGVSGRVASWTDRRDYGSPPWIRVYMGPQWKNFSVVDRDRFLTGEWKVTSQSDRVGYRLEGPVLKPEPAEIISEPVRVGSVQVPENGSPIITMRDGPTVGGYPKIALVDEPDLSWVAQVRPGQSLRFQLVS
jgi:biotin-dependent carboxylase-like uncharacterized protein